MHVDQPVPAESSYARVYTRRLTARISPLEIKSESERERIDGVKRKEVEGCRERLLSGRGRERERERERYVKGDEDREREREKGENNASFNRRLISKGLKAPSWPLS